MGPEKIYSIIGTHKEIEDTYHPSGRGIPHLTHDKIAEFSSQYKADLYIKRSKLAHPEKRRIGHLGLFKKTSLLYEYLRVVVEENITPVWEPKNP